MNTFPIEVLYIIIHHLPINCLFTVNKRLNKLYTEYYYKEYLYKNYYDLNLNITTTYKDLCQESLQEGYITFTENDLKINLLIKDFPIKGLKAVKGHSELPVHLILRFNDDLYLYNDETNESSLIEQNITDFDTNTYIKDNKLFYLYNKYDFDFLKKSKSQFSLESENCNDEWVHKLIIETKDNFSHIVFVDPFYIYAIAGNIIYRLNLETKELKQYNLNFNDSLIKGLYGLNISAISILLTNGKFLIFGYKMRLLCMLDNVSEVYGRILKIDGKYHICHNNVYEEYNDHPENLFSEINPYLLSYPILDQRIINCKTINYTCNHILAETSLYEINYNTSFYPKRLFTFDLITQKYIKQDSNKYIKRITGNWEGWYLFK